MHALHLKVVLNEGEHKISASSIPMSSATATECFGYTLTENVVTQAVDGIHIFGGASS